MASQYTELLLLMVKVWQLNRTRIRMRASGIELPTRLSDAADSSVDLTDKARWRPSCNTPPPLHHGAFIGDIEVAVYSGTESLYSSSH